MLARKPKPQAPTDPAQIRNLALRRLTVREYSEAEMLAYLKRKGVDDRLARETVAQLSSQKLISDERYAKAMTRHQVMRGKGPAYIRMKLKQKGIAAEMTAVKQIVGEVSGESDYELAKKVVDARYPKAYTDRDVAAKAYQALIRRGFSFDVARAVVFKGRDIET